MILPGSYASVLFLLFLGMLAWGTWANTFKAAGEKWRYELYCFDFAFGVLFAALLVALTLGSLGSDGFSFTDDVRVAGKRPEFFGFCAGIIFNLGNMLLLAAVSLTGMAIAFPIALGVALVIGVFWSYFLDPGGSAVLLFFGAAVTAGAVAASILAYRLYATEQLLQAAAQTGRTRPSKRKRPGSKALILSAVGGLMLGSFAPLVRHARTGELGLGPYSTGVIFALGVFFSTFAFNLFFMNLPVKGEPVDVGAYIRARAKRHGMGILGGVIWYVGAIATLLAGPVEGTAKVQPSIVYAFTQGGIIIAVLCGLYIWKELAGVDIRVKGYLGLTVVLLAIGIGLVSAGSVATAY